MAIITEVEDFDKWRDDIVKKFSKGDEKDE